MGRFLSLCGIALLTNVQLRVDDESDDDREDKQQGHEKTLGYKAPLLPCHAAPARVGVLRDGWLEKVVVVVGVGVVVAEIVVVASVAVVDVVLGVLVKDGPGLVSQRHPKSASAGRRVLRLYGYSRLRSAISWVRFVFLLEKPVAQVA